MAIRTRNCASHLLGYAAGLVAYSVSVPVCSGQTVTTEIIAIEGDFIPGTTDVFTGVSTPSVNGRGDIAFEASHTPGFLRSCVMYYDAQSQELIRLVNEGDSAPNGRGQFSEFGPQAIAISEDATLAFISELLNTIPPSVDTGIYTVHPDDGIPVEIIFEGDPVATGVFIGQFSTFLQQSGPQLPLNQQNEVAFWSSLSAPQSSTYGVYRASESGITELMRSGQVGPGIGELIEYLSAPDLNDSGEVAFVAVNGINSLAVDAIYKGKGAGLTTIAKHNQVLFPEINLDGFSRPAINNRGEVACLAYMETPIASDWGVLIGSGGAATPVWVPGEPAPGGDFKDSARTDPALNDRGQIAFVASVYPQMAGVFFWDGFQVLKVARQDEAAPAGGSFTGVFQSVAINDEGHILFLARIDDGGSTRTGLMLWDESNGLIEIIRDGDPLAGSTIASGKIYISGCETSRLVPFEQSSLGGSGVLAFEFGLDDGREGIAATTVLMPPTPQTDIRLYHALDPQVLGPSGGGSPEFSEVFTEYTTGLDEVFGVAADGVATIAIVYTTDLPGTADFHIESYDGLNEDIGAIASPDGAAGTILGDGSQTISVNTQPIGDGLHAAVALYRAPAEYVRQGSLGDALLPYRGISLRITQGPALDSDAVEATVLKVSRPPVVLVHGLWADPSTWDIAPGIESAGFWVFLVDYESTNADSFDVNDDRVCAQLWTALRQYRQQTGCSAGQAIVAGHSMGGVLTRRVIGGLSSCAFESYLNYGEGTIDRFLTIATPHHGGEAARLLVLPNGTPIPILSDIVELLEGCVDCGAVRDLHPESAATLGLPDTRSAGVASHAITGSAGDDWIALTDAFSDWIGTTSVFERVVHYLAELLIFYEDLIFGTDDHDLIVSLTSQRGGLAVGDTTDFGFAVSPFLAGTHVGLPDEDRVLNELIFRFHLKLADSSWADGFPPVPRPFAPSRGGFVPPEPYTGSGGLAVMIDGGVTTISAGSDFIATATAFGDFVPDSILIIFPFGVQAADINGAAALHVPIDAAPRAIEIRAFGRNASDEIVLSAPVSLDVTAPAQYIAMTVQPAELDLSVGSPTAQLEALGFYDDGEFRHLDPATQGIQFASGDEMIAQVDLNGVVSAVGLGETIIYLDRGSEQIAVTVRVSSTPGLEPMCPGDINNDQVIDTADLGILLSQFGTTGAGLSADLNGDGVVDTADLGALLGQFGDACNGF